MSFCPKCDSILDVNKQTAKNKKSFPDDFIDKLIKNELEENELNNIDIDSLPINEKYINLSTKIKEKIDNNISKLIKKMGPTDEVIYFCKSCGYTCPIQKRQLIMSKIGKSYTSGVRLTPDKIRIMVNDKTLPHTRGYICTNEKCISHKENDKRDAVFFRFPNSLQTWYICTACQNYWAAQ